MATQKSIPAPPPATTSVLGTVAVSSSALPTGAATAANQATEIASLAAIDAGIPAALGTAVMAASMPVTIASDQPPLSISGSITADIQGDYVDDSAFTVATDRGVAVGGTFTTDSIDAGDFGAFKINAKRELFVVQDTAANLNATVNQGTSPWVVSGTSTVSGTVTTAEAAPTTIFNGAKTVAVAGTAEALAGSTAIKGVTIKALAANTGVIYVGNSGVTSANGHPLNRGQSISLDIANLATVFLNSSVSAEGATYLAVN